MRPIALVLPFFVACADSAQDSGADETDGLELPAELDPQTIGVGPTTYVLGGNTFLINCDTSKVTLGGVDRGTGTAAHSIWNGTNWVPSPVAIAVEVQHSRSTAAGVVSATANGSAMASSVARSVDMPTGGLHTLKVRASANGVTSLCQQSW
jgi:hypothetical protein